MSIQFNFSNLPCKILPQCERYLYMLYHFVNRNDHLTEMRLFQSDFTGQNGESFIIRLRKLGGNKVQIMGIASVVYTDSKPSVWALATNQFSDRSELSFHINERGMALTELFAYWQRFVINDMRKNDVIYCDALPAFTFSDALNETMLHWGNKTQKALSYEEPYSEWALELGVA